MVNNLVLWHEKSGQIGEKRLADIQCLYLIPERLQTGWLMSIELVQEKRVLFTLNKHRPRVVETDADASGLSDGQMKDIDVLPKSDGNAGALPWCYESVRSEALFDRNTDTNVIC